MKILYIDPSGRDDKINFIDENNVFVGYDLGQNCCECAGWMLTDRLTMLRSEDIGEDVGHENLPDLTDYRFDPNFFVDAKVLFGATYENDVLDEGGHVIFRLVSETGPDFFLNIYNSHNGYYSHGFEYGVAGGKVTESYL